MSGEDYVFRYKVEYINNVHPNEMIRSQLKNLFNVITLCYKEEEIKVDGFKLINNTDRYVYKIFEQEESQEESIETEDKEVDSDKIFYQDLKNATLFEPRIELIKKQLESILSVVELESEGKVVKIDGFRLKDLSKWLVPSAGDPMEVFEHAGTRCNCNCVFCYNKGVPPSLALKNSPKKAEEELKEIKTRIKYFSPRAGRSLFPTMGSTCEVLAHPYILEILNELRHKTKKPFRIATNGVALTPQMIENLAKLAPVYLDISLNSSSPSRRSKLMHDKKPEVTIKALPLLRLAKIPYSTVIVPWPVDNEKEMLDDLENTIAYSEENDTHLIQISLPGYSRYFSQVNIFDREETWNNIIAKIGVLREKYNCPIVVMPNMYEENITRQKKNIPEVIGVVKNSPAMFAGIKRGDIIKRIAGINVRNRPQVRDLLTICQQQEITNVILLVQRNNYEIEINIDLAKYAYPYHPLTSTHLGIIFMGTGLRTGYLERLKEIIITSGARDVLFLSSKLVRPMLEQCLKENYFTSVKLEIVVPKNRYFGGNIIMGDLLVIEDFIYCIKEYVSKNKKPDLVVIPSSPFNLSQWGRDLTGRCYLDIEREVGIPVKLLECNTIFD